MLCTIKKKKLACWLLSVCKYSKVTVSGSDLEDIALRRKMDKSLNIFKNFP